MPLVPSTNLTFNIPVFQNGVKDSSLDEQKQLPDHESEAVHSLVAQENQTNDSRRAQVVTRHHLSDSAVQARVEVRKPHGTHIQTWPSRTFETNPGEPRWAACHPGSPSLGQAVPRHLCLGWPAPWHPGAQANKSPNAELRVAEVRNTLPEPGSSYVDTLARRLKGRGGAQS
uniref:Uncharacterized protein n=1 Tax=Rhipicephalus zambeziensis TaxID=60191 RepID=A0A224YAL3_9ACAR